MFRTILKCYVTLMKLPPKKVLISIAIGISIFLIVLVTILMFRRRSSFQWPPGSSPTIPENTLSTNLTAAQTAYNLAIYNAGGDATAIATAEKIRSSAVKTAVTTFVASECPDAAATGASTTNAAQWATYQNDLRAIQNAYVGLLNNPGGDLVIAARKADIGGATRKYIANVCSKFYMTSSSDPTTYYKNWAVGSTTNGFDSRRLLTSSGGNSVTWGSSNLNAWYNCSANVFTVDGTRTIVYGAAASLGGEIIIPIVENLANKGLATNQIVQYSYNVPVTDAAPTSYITSNVISTIVTGVNTSSITIKRPIADAFYIPDGTLVAVSARGETLSGGASSDWRKYDTISKLMFWKMAREYGPGSVQTNAISASTGPVRTSASNALFSISNAGTVLAPNVNVTI